MTTESILWSQILEEGMEDVSVIEINTCEPVEQNIKGRDAGKENE